MQVQTATASVQNPSAIAQTVVSQKPKRETAKQKEVKQLNRVNLRTFIVRQNGKFVSVAYRKIGGEKRTLIGRLGVTFCLKGGENKVERDERPYLTMFDVKLAQYRTVSLDTVSEIRAQGIVWQIID
jgi:hypothetical protein